MGDTFLTRSRDDTAFCHSPSAESLAVHLDGVSWNTVCHIGWGTLSKDASTSNTRPQWFALNVYLSYFHPGNNHIVVEARSRL